MFALRILVLSALTVFAGSLRSQEVVETASGPVQGIPAREDSSITVFKGIPFAEPPVGDLRWKAPQPAKSWDEVRVCDKFGPISWQGKEGNKSEDCLYLNVWAPPKTEKKLPVMVWIHGGGLTSGAGSLKNYDGEAFAKRDVILVSINYRLGALGYFAHPQLSEESRDGVSGNYGFLDQVAALKWVQQNIEAFGGDKDRVTIFGESAGGTSVYVLTASPLAKGLFHRAILQSPWLDPVIFKPLRSASTETPSAESIGAKAAAELVGDSDDALAKLRELSAEEIIGGLRGRMPVVIGGKFLPENPEQIFAAGSHNQVPIIAGTNRDEGTMFAGGAAGQSVEQYEKRIQPIFGDDTQKVLEFYDLKKKSQVLPTAVQMITDGWFVQPTRRYCRQVAGSGGKVWMYHFTRVSPNWSWLGAAHAAEIVFVFNTLNPNKMKGDNEKIANAMISYWVQFAKSGNPNVGELHDWPQYDSKSDKHLVIDAEMKVDSGLRSEACNMLDSIRPVAN
ncbi:MAG: carboxylesterase/lipase family protein [Planctomycetota bacterium]